MNAKVNQPAYHTYPIPAIFGVPHTTKGEVGLELEVIGKNLPSDFIETNQWDIHEDASVKVRQGEMAKEYVFRRPLGRAKLKPALEALEREFANSGATVAEGRVSNSVHVHINAQDLTMKQVYTWLALYFLFEELLVRWAGEDRVGNLFCLRAKDAEGLIRLLSTCAQKDQFHTINSTTYRYAACNIVSLAKFGSVEFRALRGTMNKDVILEWVNTLLAIRDKSLEFRDPTHVLAEFSRRSCIGMAVHILPPSMRDFMLLQPDFPDAMYGGARLAQDFAFATKWQEKNLTYEEALALVKGGVPTKKKMGLSGFTPAPTWGEPVGLSGGAADFVQMVMGAAPQATTQEAPPIQREWFVVKDNDQGIFLRTHSTFAGAVRRMKYGVNNALRDQGYTVNWSTAQSGNFQALAIIKRSTGRRARWVTEADFEPQT